MNRFESRTEVRVPASQRGSVLIIALLMLIGVTLLSISGAITGSMELRMARNYEAGASAFQSALAAIDFVLSDEANLPVSGPLNQLNEVTLSGATFDTADDESIVARAARVQDCALPPRARSASSLMAYSAFRYEVLAEVDRTASGLGRSAMTQGYVLLGPKC
jgi:hypothetical protein